MPRASLILLVALLLCCWSEEDQWQWATTPTTSVAPRHSSTPLSGFAAAAPLQNPAESVAPQPQDAERESAKYEPKNKKTNQKNKSKKKKKDKKLQGKGKEEASGNFQQQQQQQQQQRPSQGSGSGSGGSRSQQLERAASQFKQLWVRAVALNDVRTLSLLLERRQQTVPFDTEDCGDPTRTCLHTALAGYHSALQSGKGFAGDAESTGQFSADQAHGIRAGGAVNSRNPLLQTLSLLTDHAGLNAAHFCPVVDAVHFRLVDGIHFLVDRMSPHEIAECLGEKDFFGANLFHVLGNSMASGFARWFLALRFQYPNGAARQEIERQMGIGQRAFMTEFYSEVASAADLDEPADVLTFADISAAVGDSLPHYMLNVASNTVGVDAVALLQARDSQGLTPVMNACVHGNIPAFRQYLLFLQNANRVLGKADTPPSSWIDWQNVHGWRNRTCTQVAQARGFRDIVAVLANPAVNSKAAVEPSTTAPLQSVDRMPLLDIQVNAAEPPEEIPLCSNCGWAGIPVRTLVDLKLARIAHRSGLGANDTTMPIVLVHPQLQKTIPAVASFDFRSLGENKAGAVEHAKRAVSQLDTPIVLRGAVDSLSSDEGWNKSLFLREFGTQMVDVAFVPYATSYDRQNSRQTIQDFVSVLMGQKARSLQQLARLVKNHNADYERNRTVRIGVDEAGSPSLSAPSTGDAGIFAGVERFDEEGMGIDYIFDSRLLGFARRGVLRSVVEQDLEKVLYGGSALAEGQEATSTEQSSLRNAHLRLHQFAMGGALSGAAPHFHGFAVNFLLRGAKLWFLAAPSSAFAQFTVQSSLRWWMLHFPHVVQQLVAHHANSSTAHDLGVRLVLQWPGDVVIVPEHWSHSVLNLADTIAVALEYANI